MDVFIPFLLYLFAHVFAAVCKLWAVVVVSMFLQAVSCDFLKVWLGFDLCEIVVLSS